jgi:transcriptional regulator with XRE-family HTH domain
VEITIMPRSALKPHDLAPGNSAGDYLQSVAQRVRLERAARGWNLAELAKRAGVSRAMISKIERAEVSPTAMLLGKLSGAFELPLSVLLARAENSGRRLIRHHEQQVWQDPGSGYVRRPISPPGSGPLELIDVTLPPRKRVRFPASSYTFLHQQIWVGQGTLNFTEGDVLHVLGSGDCLQLGAPQDCEFHNPTSKPCRYLVAIVRH